MTPPTVADLTPEERKRVVWYAEQFRAMGIDPAEPDVVTDATIAWLERRGPCPWPRPCGPHALAGG